MTWGGTALTSVAQTVSMPPRTSSLMVPGLEPSSSSSSLRVLATDTAWAVPRDRERPTPSLVPTRRARIGIGLVDGGRDDDDDDDDDDDAPWSFVVEVVEAVVDEVARTAGRYPDDALSRSTR